MVGNPNVSECGPSSTNVTKRKPRKKSDDLPEEDLDEVPILNLVNGIREQNRPNIDALEPEEEYHSDASSENEGSIPTDDDEEDDISELIKHTVEGNPEFSKFVSETDDLYFQEDKVDDSTVVSKGLHIGQVWATMEECRNYIKDLAISQNIVIRQVKNKKHKQSYVCDDSNCKWRVYCSLLSDKQTFMVKSGHFEHSCESHHGLRHPMANARWVARNIFESFRAHPDYKPKNLKAEVLLRLKVKISYWTAWHARHLCLERLMGNYEKSYKLLPELCNQVLQTNPGSIACVSTFPGSMCFKGLCIAYKASLDGFVKGCRPILGLDGCFLKGKYGGVVLSIISLDANNGLFPVAIYICKKECKETWVDFLEIVVPKLTLHLKPLTFISDMQKGLVEAIKYVFTEKLKLNHFHRYCFRHLYKNFKKVHPGLNLEKITWAAAKSYTRAELNTWMEKLEEAKMEAKLYMDDEKPETWARSHFDTTSKCEHITNNFSEAFNAWILDLRMLPVCNFVDRYHLLLMRLFYDRNGRGQEMENDTLVPRTVRILREHKNHCHLYDKEPSTETLWNVRDNKDMHWNVDLIAHTCTCCAWQITGIPCVHAVSVILHFRERNFNRYVDPYHLVDAYRRTYDAFIRPLPHMSEWGEPVYVVNTPEYSRPAGRPRTQRRRDRDEINGFTRAPRQCGKCGQFGHNRTTCKGAPAWVATPGPVYYAGPHMRRGRGGNGNMPHIATEGQGRRGGRGGRVGARGGGRVGGRGGGRGGGGGRVGGRGRSESSTNVDPVGTASGRVIRQRAEASSSSQEPLSQPTQQSTVTQVSQTNLSTQASVDTTTYSYTRNPLLFIPPMPKNLPSPILRGGGVRKTIGGVKVRGGGVGGGSTSTPSTSGHGGKRSKLDENAWSWSSPPVPSPLRRSGRLSGGLGSKLNGLHIDLD